jgi:hypothetical protein
LGNIIGVDKEMLDSKSFLKEDQCPYIDPMIHGIHKLHEGAGARK